MISLIMYESCQKVQSDIDSYKLKFVLIIIINTEKIKSSKYKIHDVLPCVCADTMPNRDKF